MTKKTLNPLDDPPTASSSDDDEVHTSAGEEEEEEEEEDSSSEEAPSAAVTVAVPGKTTVTKQGSDSDSGSETETDSDSETGSGKSMAVTVVATNPKKKEATLALPAMKSGTKRPSEGTSRDGGGNAKKKNKIGEDIKKPAFQRLWSEEDEIALLQGMIDFRDDTGKIPYEDTNGFYDYMKKSISVEVSKSQFMDKIRSLKKKYTGKGKNGKDVSFTKPHDVKSFGLSKFIWGPDGMGIESAKSNGISKKSKSKKLESVKQDLFLGNGKMVEEVDDDDDDGKKVVVETGKTTDWFENSFLVGSIASFGVDEYTVKQRWREAPVEDKKKIEEKMKALRAKEIEYVLEKTKFLNDFASMIAEASK
ncbi:hypothetical protein AALP_AAs49271U000100 [Arabis alpina]|uniref:Uncharacterized protein n=1 Tax=Arabis alpina TaxID=50452 RepID=A0A087G197_ARAAL|nr:hypothetical protein AALP_AAs49271U000100 [Arabis alpina]